MLAYQVAYLPRSFKLLKSELLKSFASQKAQIVFQEDRAWRKLLRKMSNFQIEFTSRETLFPRVWLLKKPFVEIKLKLSLKLVPGKFRGK